MKKTLMALVAFAIAIPAMAQTSAPSRIAVINVQKVLLESTQGKVAREKVEKLATAKQEQGKKLAGDADALDKEITAKRMSLSPEKLAEMQKSLDQKKIELQRFAQDSQREVREAEEKAILDLEKAIRPVIDQIGKEMGFAAIFNKMESGLVYASDAIDVTDVVIKRFNEATAAPAAAAPKN
jgi:outer membrane protein